MNISNMKARVIVNLINGKYDLKEIGARIRAEREKKGLSLEELGNRVDVSRQTLSKWERGAESSSPTLPDYLRLCIEFGCDLQYLLCENECSTKDIQGIADYTGLPESTILSLAELSKHEMRSDIFLFLHDLIDSFDIEAIAGYYRSYVNNRDKAENPGFYTVNDENGTIKGALSGDIDLLLLKQAFDNFLYGPRPSFLSRSAVREEYEKLTPKERESLREKAETMEVKDLG